MRARVVYFEVMGTPLAPRNAMTTKKQLHQVEDTARDVFERAAEKGKDIYLSAKEWLPENYTNPWVIGTGVVAIGLTGFLLGRSSRGPSKSESEPRFKPKPFDQDKIMKFAKLWLLYRATR